MKYLILLILSINTALACQLSIPMSDVTRALNPPVSGAYLKCEDFPNEECICIEKANTWYSELKEEIVNGDPIYSPKENVKECAELECQELGPDYCKDFDGYEFFYAATSIGLGYEAYCAKIVGYEQVNTGKHILVESEDKKAAYLAKIEKEKKDAEDLKLKKSADKVKAKDDIDKATTIAALRKALKDYIEASE